MSLRRVTQGVSRIIYAEHIEGYGIALFSKACELDLEGIVAKDGSATITVAKARWLIAGKPSVMPFEGEF
jgi:ATP-dependent DNA ligase